MASTLAGAAIVLLFGSFALIGVYHTVIYFCMTLSPILFYTLVPAATLFFAAGVVFLKDPVYNLLSLIAVFFNVVLFYLYAGAEFLAFLFLIVYVGAIAILFLFVIMLLHLKEKKTEKAISVTPSAVFFFPLSLLIVLGADSILSNAMTTFFAFRDLVPSSLDSVSLSALTHYISNRHTDILLFSDLLYTAYSYLFYISSLLLLTAMLGAIVLAASTTDLVKAFPRG